MVVNWFTLVILMYVQKQIFKMQLMPAIQMLAVMEFMNIFRQGNLNVLMEMLLELQILIISLIKKQIAVYIGVLVVLELLIVQAARQLLGLLENYQCALVPMVIMMIIQIWNV